VDANLLIILTDISGLYTADPRRDPQAVLLEQVDTIDERIWEMAGGSGTQRGTGGMHTKIKAADLATRSGTEVVITSGTLPDIVLRTVSGERLGTRFGTTVSNLESRKRWVLAETVLHSRVTIDSGAAQALTTQGKSLLAAGIRGVDGSFDRGQTIRIYDTAGHEIARGITQYRASDLAIIQGVQSARIAELLGYAYGPEVVHRDDMVIL
jgi:glutamate 5-kinase